MVSILFGKKNVLDETQGETPTEQKSYVVEEWSHEAGMQRLKQMITKDEFGGLTQEMNTIGQVGFMSFFMGALYGGVLSSRVAYVEFFRNNQATVFADHLEAKKRLQDKVTVSFAKGAFRWGWRLSLFSASYVGMSTAISVYRGKTGILEHVLAGCFTGAAYKFNMGPKGWIVGGGLGSILGLIAGCTTLGLLKIAGISMEEARTYSSGLVFKRKEAYQEGIKNYREKEDLQLLIDHDKKLGNASKSLDELDK